ncbi:MAG: OmpA family protein [Stellaceae bacterium]
MKSAQWLLVVFAILSLGACARQEAPPPPQAAARPPAPPPAPPPQAAAPAEPEALYVYFAINSARLDQSATEVIDHAARLYREGHPSVMLVAGHADRTGEEFPNVLLSAKRAEAVKRAMVARGIPEATLSISADGWADPPVPEQPNQPEPKNRVSIVTWR